VPPVNSKLNKILGQYGTLGFLQNSEERGTTRDFSFLNNSLKSGLLRHLPGSFSTSLVITTNGEIGMLIYSKALRWLFRIASSSLGLTL
jgi:hypothetical protein